nr:retrovirus-related Pol polyprotein from transposon TNT 1-94 [Tanacetum cinerariifolium]
METLNIELDHKVTKLATENDHLKQTYKQLYDSIKSSRVRSKEQCDDLIKKVNIRSAEVSDLNARLQEKVLVDVTPVVPKLHKNRTAHTDYIRHTQEEAATLRKIVKSKRLLSPLNTSLDYAVGISHETFTLQDYYEEVGISHETSVARSPQQNGVVKRRNRTLIEAAGTMLIYAQALLFLWAKAVATACFTQNRSIIRLRHGKTPYELLHNKLSDLSFFHVFGALFYPTNDSENLDKLQPKADIGIFIGYAPTKKAFRIYNQLNANSTGSPSSTTVEQDAPSTSNSTTPTETQSSIIPQDVRDENLDIEVAHMGSDSLFDHPLPHHNSKWVKDHPLNNIIGQLDRPVSTRLQLYEQALFCYYDAFLTSVEPKTYKEALTQSCWIEAMQEELNEF